MTGAHLETPRGVLRAGRGQAPAHLTLWLGFATHVLGAGCGTQVAVAPTARGGAGESCETSSGCEEGLSCIDLVCREGAAAADTPNTPGTLATDDAGRPLPVPNTPGTPVARSDVGESCARRADCATPLACIERVCRDDRSIEEGGEGADGPRKGSRGESCVASNDCELGMGCIGGACRARTLVLSHVESECHRIECVESEDCCAAFAPEDPLFCDELETGCQADVRADCNLYVSLCTCTRLCEDSVCVASLECEDDLDCGGSGVLRCFAGHCAQCASDSDCVGVSACVGGLCRSGCDRNEECPIFSECREHRCEPVGCQSDRDCFFESGSGGSRCVDHACRTPCSSDLGCPLAFDGCVDGFCAFVGCQSDDECRAALRLQDLPQNDPSRGVCRAPAE